MLKYEFVVSLPNAGFCAIKHSAHRACEMLRIETAALVETRIANYFGTLPYCSCESDTRRVVINASDETTWIGGILAESVRHRLPRLVTEINIWLYAPFNRLFSRRSE